MSCEMITAPKPGDPWYGDIISHAQNASLDQLVIIPDVGRVNNCVSFQNGDIRRNNAQTTSLEFHERI